MRTILRVAMVLSVAILGLTLVAPMDERVLAGGEVRPERWSMAYPQRAGVLSALLVKVGDHVETGQELARLDDLTARSTCARLKAEAAQAEAEHAEAVASLTRTTAVPIEAEFLFNAGDLERQRSLLDDQRSALAKIQELHRNGGASDLQLLSQRQQVTSGELTLRKAEKATAAVASGYGEATIAAATAKVAAAAAHLESVRAQVLAAEQDLDRHIIRAPAAGVVIALGLRFPGEQLALGSALAKIAGSERPTIRLRASEDRIAEIKPGQLVRFRPRSDPDRLGGMRSGRILEVSPDRELTSADADAEGRPYRILVEVADDPRSLPWGAQVDAEIVVRERPFWRLLTLADTTTTKH